MHSVEQLAAHLRATGGKLTAQRLFLFRALEGATNHPTAEEIYEQVRQDLPTLSLATVYKTLAELVELGEVRTVEAGDGRMRFDPNTAPHVHFVCRACGRLMDGPPEAAQPYPRVVDGFLVLERRVTLEGYCASCRPPVAALDVDVQ